MDPADPSNLNRLGIVLNFIAGFLLAPQLIGQDRVLRIEKRIERVSAVTRIAIKQGNIIMVMKSEEDIRDHLTSYYMYRILTSTASVIVPFLFIISWNLEGIESFVFFAIGGLALFESWWMISAWLGLFPGGIQGDEWIPYPLWRLLLRAMFGIFAAWWVWNNFSPSIIILVIIVQSSPLLLTGVFDLIVHRKEEGSTLLAIAVLSLTPAHFLIYWPFIVFVNIYYAICEVIVFVCDVTISFLDTATNKLEGYMVTIGVFCFIIGNAFQFLGTFEKNVGSRAEPSSYERTATPGMEASPHATKSALQDPLDARLTLLGAERDYAERDYRD